MKFRLNDYTVFVEIEDEGKSTWELKDEEIHINLVDDIKFDPDDVIVDLFEICHNISNSLKFPIDDSLLLFKNCYKYIMGDTGDVTPDINGLIYDKDFIKFINEYSK